MSHLNQSILRCGFGDSLKALLMEHLSQPWRHYHTTEHIAELLTKFDTVRHLAAKPLAIEKAIWFHDIIYMPGRDDNEDQSILAATWALPGDPDMIDIKRLIAATKDHDGNTPDEALMCDLDLSILAEPPDTYDCFEDAIRQEYLAVPDAIYRQGRRRILSGFLARPRIFVTEAFREKEDLARSNLQRGLDSLRRTWT
jgi:predicted metal-dependent HD superfamily phosphohydrolase